MAEKNSRTNTDKRTFLDDLLSEEEKQNIFGVADHLYSHIQDNGYMPASLSYRPYDHHWFRDASLVASRLIDFSNILETGLQDGSEYSSHVKKSRDKALSLILFMCDAIDSFSDNIKHGIEIDVERRDFWELSSHFPARVNKSGRLSSTDEGMEGLRQYDSIPLILNSCWEYIDSFGVDNFKPVERKIRKNIEALTDYMLKVYNTECANAWEMYWNKIHSYDVLSIEAGLESASKISGALGLGIEVKRLEEKSRINYPSGIIGFLRDMFIRDNGLRDSKKTWGKKGFETEPENGLDSAFIFIVSGTRKNLLDENTYKKTVSRIERTLMDKNTLSLRFVGDGYKDVYFYGGRWLPVSLRLAGNYLETAEIDKADKIVEYINKKFLSADSEKIETYVDKKYRLAGKYNVSKEKFALPEQVVIDPASDRDQDCFLEKNDGVPILCLAWSEAEYLCPASKLPFLRSQGNGR